MRTWNKSPMEIGNSIRFCTVVALLCLESLSAYVFAAAGDASAREEAMKSFRVILKKKTETAATPFLYSKLWGKEGELWNPRSRLPDVSFAGYHRGERPIPYPPVTHNVKDFGARGDGVHDDTEAFRKAISACDKGVIFIPPGTYRLTGQLRIDKSNIVLRGAGPDQTILYFPRGMGELSSDDQDGKLKSAADKNQKNNKSCFIVVDKGKHHYYPKVLGPQIGEMTQRAERGTTRLSCKLSKPLQAGTTIVLSESTFADFRKGKRQYKNPELMRQLCAGDQNPGAIVGLNVYHITRVVSVDGNDIVIDRPLRYGMKARIFLFEPLLSEIGLEDFAIRFNNQPYDSHFGGPGNNAISIRHCANSWIRNIAIHNADNGIQCLGVFCTISDIEFTADRMTCTEYQIAHIPGLIVKANPIGKKYGIRPPDDPVAPGERVQLLDCTGHHGITVNHFDNLVERITFNTVFVHSITVNKTIGCAISDVKGIDVCLDHHRRAPSENVWTNIDAGKGTHLWLSSGRGQEGIQ